MKGVFAEGAPPRIRPLAWAASLLVALCVALSFRSSPPGLTSVAPIASVAATETGSPLDRLFAGVEQAAAGGRTAVAGQLLNAAAERLRAGDASASPGDNLRYYDASAKLAAARRQWADAVAATEEAIALASALHGPESREVAYRYQSMAGFYQRLGQHNAALLCREKELNIALKDEGVDKVALAQKFNGLGLMYLQIKQYDRAVDVHRRALVLLQRQPDPSADYLAGTKALLRQALEAANPMPAVPEPTIARLPQQQEAARGPAVPSLTDGSIDNAAP